MSSRLSKVVCFAIALMLAFSVTPSVHAQYSCGQGNGGGYAYQSRAYYGQPTWAPNYGGYPATSFYSPSNYPQIPTIGFPGTVPAPVGIPQQSYYSNNYYNTYPAHYSHSNHPWHPGHYLLGF